MHRRYRLLLSWLMNSTPSMDKRWNIIISAMPATSPQEKHLFHPMPIIPVFDAPRNAVLKAGGNYASSILSLPRPWPFVRISKFKAIVVLASVTNAILHGCNCYFLAMRQLAFSLVIINFVKIIENICFNNSIQFQERLLIQRLPNRFFSRFNRFLVIHRAFCDNIFAPGQKIIAISIFFPRQSVPLISIMSNQIKIIILPENGRIC